MWIVLFAFSDSKLVRMIHSTIFGTVLANEKLALLIHDAWAGHIGEILERYKAWITWRFIPNKFQILNSQMKSYHVFGHLALFSWLKTKFYGNYSIWWKSFVMSVEVTNKLCVFQWFVAVFFRSHPDLWNWIRFIEWM